MTITMKIKDVFKIPGRGTVVTGIIENGILKVNDKVEIVSGDGKTLKTVIAGIDMSNKMVDEADVGDNVGLLLRGVKADEVCAGQYVNRL